MKKELLKIGALVFDSDIYIREKVSWLTAYQYSQAMKAGSVFPPITVGSFDKKRYVIDGWHRVEALTLLGEEYVSAVVKPFSTMKDMFAEAVKLNSVHGRPLSGQDKVRIIHKLEGFKFSLKEISEIVKVPIDKIERFRTRVIKGPNGKPVYLKSVIAKALASTEKTGVKVNQDSFNVRNVQQLLEQLIELLESGIYPTDDDVRGLSVRLYKLLGEELELTVEAT